jgi:hypothetical protein
MADRHSGRRLPGRVNRFYVNSTACHGGGNGSYQAEGCYARGRSASGVQGYIRTGSLN